MSTLKVDSIQGSTGSTITIPAGQVMHFTDQPVGTGFSAAVAGSLGGATTSDTASKTVHVDVPQVISRNVSDQGDAPEYVPYTTVATRMTFTNGVLTDAQGGVGRFMRLVNRSFVSSWFGILSTGGKSGGDHAPFDFGTFMVARFKEDGLGAWIFKADPENSSGVKGTVVNGNTSLLVTNAKYWFYVRGSLDSGNKGVWMNHENLGWFWWSTETVRPPENGKMGGIWVYSTQQQGGNDLGWCFWMSIASDSTAETGGGVGSWIWSATNSKWAELSASSTVVAQIASGATGPSTDAPLADNGAAPTGNTVPSAEQSDNPPANSD